MLVCLRICYLIWLHLWGYRDGSPTAIQAWRTCPLWELSPSHPILVLVYTRGLVVLILCISFCVHVYYCVCICVFCCFRCLICLL